MSGSILREVGGFTPVIDVVAEDVGFVTAAVYGVHWRYCQMEDGVSRAAMQRIAAHLGISVKTARRHTRKLCERGYLQDLTPGLTHAPHTYCDNGWERIDELLEGRSDRASTVKNAGLDRASTQAGQPVQPGWTESTAGSDAESSKDSRKKEEEKESSRRRLSDLWFVIQLAVRGMMTRSMFESYYEKAKPLSLEGDVLTVALADEGAVEATRRLNALVVEGVERQMGVRLAFVAGGGDGAAP